MAKFLTSARAVDMLGRQQIAGIPTAISELFKNSYDAYATAVRADYFPDRRVLAIRDNGVGMSEDDFQTRWLTIGTDSKARGALMAPPPRPEGVSPRRQMGEKGIGRLAVASVGSQILLVTKPMHPSNGPLTVALVQWNMFEVPGLTLDDVAVPSRSLMTVDEIDQDLVLSLTREIESRIGELKERIPEAHRRKILQNLDAIRFDPRPLLRLNGPQLDVSNGTAFIIAPVSEDLDSALNAENNGRYQTSVSPFQRFLSGFANTMLPGHPEPRISTRFVVHEKESVVDIIDPERFWQPEDFELTDHTIQGEFDKYGSFSGTVSVYGRQPVPYVEPWTTGGRPSRCGPFRLKLGYVQGKASDSRLTPEDFVLMTAKLQQLGGIYIYRDDIRVLPYGNSDVDYLEIEQRRTLSAGRYYFSYRRMFGAIELDSESSPDLQEKAGREGFRENAAYRDFTDILKNFLIQLASNFFSSSGDQSNQWQTERDRLKRRASARGKEDRAAHKARVEFAEQIEMRLSRLESGEVTRFLTSLEQEVSARIGAVITAEDSSKARNVFLIEEQTQLKLEEFMQGLRISRPQDLALSSDLEREWLSYQRLISHAVAEARSTLERISATMEKALDNLRSNSTRDLARQVRISRLASRRKRRTTEIRRQVLRVSQVADELLQEAADEATREFRGFETEAGLIIDEFHSGTASAAQLALLHERMDGLAADHSGNLQRLIERIRRAADGTADHQVHDNTLLQEQVLDLQQQIDQNLELMQLGMAVQLVSHEFEASIRAVRHGLQQLAPWARSTPRLAPVVRDLRASFGHLDGYLRLFTPLQRRLYRQRVTITGNEIFEFVNGVFADRLERHGVQLDVTESFRYWRVSGFPSTFYPVFVNLVDNAIHWSSTNVVGTPRIVLDGDTEGMYVRDSGPGVRRRDREAIFERGFSRRRGGRGLGLALSRDLLQREGWTLTLEADGQSRGASFKVAPEKNGVE